MVLYELYEEMSGWARTNSKSADATFLKDAPRPVQGEGAGSMRAPLLLILLLLGTLPSLATARSTASTHPAPTHPLPAAPVRVLITHPVDGQTVHGEHVLVTLRCPLCTPESSVCLSYAHHFSCNPMAIYASQHSKPVLQLALPGRHSVRAWVEMEAQEAPQEAPPETLRAHEAPQEASLLQEVAASGDDSRVLVGSESEVVFFRAATTEEEAAAVSVHSDDCGISSDDASTGLGTSPHCQALAPERRARAFDYVWHTNMYTESVRDGSVAEKDNAQTVLGSKAAQRIVLGLVTKLRIELLLDIPCGDFSWMSMVDFGGVHHTATAATAASAAHRALRYIGVDISGIAVDKARARVREQSATKETARLLPPGGATFQQRDVVTESLREMLRRVAEEDENEDARGDRASVAAAHDGVGVKPRNRTTLIFARDLSRFLNIAQNVRFFENVQQSGVRWFAATTYLRTDDNYAQRNFHLITGGNNFPNLMRPPFCLADPVELLYDGYLGRYVGVWDLHERPFLFWQHASSGEPDGDVGCGPIWQKRRDAATP